MAISLASMANASVPVVIPSGQQLYFEFYPSSAYPNADGYAVVCSPVSGSNNGWVGYTTPGGNVIIPDTILHGGQKYVVTQLSSFVFSQCGQISSIIVPNTVSIIGNYAFWGCTSLRTLTIGEGVVRMASFVNYEWSDQGIVADCTSLDTIYFNADSCWMGHILAIDACANIGQHTAVVIGDNVRYIGPNMFNKYNSTNSITSVVVGSSVASIDYGAFLNCSDLTSISFRSQNPPMLGAVVFDGVNTDSVQCIIPCGRTANYFNQWGTLFNYTEASSPYTLTLSSNYDSWGTAEVIQQPSCDGNAIIGATASCGYYFVRWSDGNMDNPRPLTLQNDTYLTAIFASSYNVPDTVFVHDTTIINNYIHDTTYLPVYLHDTVTIIEYLHDTIYLPQYIHDTTVVSVHDTTYVPYPVHDTTYVLVTDTITQYDTVNNYIYDTITLYDTITIHDTIVIHDTIEVGIDNVETINAKIYQRNGQVVVEGAEGNTVTLYDVNGRVLATKQDEHMPICFDAPVTGTYMIKIGNYPARKVVVVR